MSPEEADIVLDRLQDIIELVIYQKVHGGQPWKEIWKHKDTIKEILIKD